MVMGIGIGRAKSNMTSQNSVKTKRYVHKIPNSEFYPSVIGNAGVPRWVPPWLPFEKQKSPITDDFSAMAFESESSNSAASQDSAAQESAQTAQKQKTEMLADEDPLLISQSLTYVTDDGSVLHSFHSAPFSTSE